MEDSDLKPLQCPNCKRVYSLKTKANFETHMKSCGKGQYKCNVCYKDYSSIHTLKNHLKLHIGGTVYQCTVCGKEFTQKFSLTLHMNVHKDKSERKNDRMQCNYCNKTFAWSSSLNRHMQDHFNKESLNYHCEKCGHGFTNYVKFYNHKLSCSTSQKKKPPKNKRKTIGKISFDTRLHRCQFCNQGFKDREDLDGHVTSCDTLFLGNQGCNGNVMSKDERGAIDKILSVKMSKCVSLHAKSVKKMKMDKDVMSFNTSEVEDTVEVSEHSIKTAQGAIEISGNAVQVEIRDTEESIEDILEGMEADLNKPEKSDTISKNNTKSTKITTSIQGEMMSKFETKTRINSQRRNVKPNKPAISTYNRKRRLEDVDDNFSPKDSGIDNTLSIQNELLSPSRRTQRIRKPKQFPGYDVNIPKLNIKEEKEADCDNVNSEMEEAAQVTDDPDLKDNKHTRAAIRKTSKYNRENNVKNKKREVEPHYENNKDPTVGTKTSENEQKKQRYTKSKDNSVKIPQTVGKNLQKEDAIETKQNSDANSQISQSEKVQTNEKEAGDFSHRLNKLKVKKLDITYECVTANCCKIFYSMTDIASHKKLVHKELFRNLCSKCHKEFGSYAIYRSHIRMEHSDEDYLTFSLKNTNIIVKDRNNAADMEILVCTKCGYRYGSQEDSGHKCEPHKLCYFCPCCQFTSSKADEISEHISTNHQGEYHEIKNKDQYGSLRSAAKEPGWNVGNEATMCTLCQLEHDTNKDLKQHMNEKHAVYPFACGLCRLCYGRKNPLIRHLLTHKKSHIVCNVCQKEFYEKIRLDAHMLTHTGQRPYQCEICGNRYCDDKGVKKHMMLKHVDYFRATYPDSALGREYHSNNSDKSLTPAMCHLCGKTFRLEKYLTNHMKTHSETYIMYTCPYCDQTFRKKSAFRAHKLKHMTFDVSKQENEFSASSTSSWKDILNSLKLYEEGHPSGLPYRCGACMKRFKDVKGISLHINTMHIREKDKRHICPKCGRGFARLAALRIHMRLHTNSKPYRCKICNKRYRQLSHIRQHLLYHGKPIMECKLCRRPFKAKPNLRGHVKTHCTIFPFQCPGGECTAAFQSLDLFLTHVTTCLESVDTEAMLGCSFCQERFTKSKITSHYYSHENENKFPCELCEMTFKDFPSLYFHKESADHFLESELGKSNASDYNISQALIVECDYNWSPETLMSQYEYIETGDEQGGYFNDYAEQGKIDDEREVDDTDGELILIAEQLTHMASGVPFREVIVQGTDTRDYNGTEIAIDELGEVVPEKVADTEMNMVDTSSEVESMSKFIQQADGTYQYMIEANQVNSIADDNMCQENKVGIEYTLQQTEINEVNEVNVNHVPEINLHQTEDIGINGDKLDTENGSLVTESSVEEIVDNCEIGEHGTPDNLSAQVKFVDQKGNEIIVYVLNEVGEQIRVTDSEEILNTVVQSGDYSILQNTDEYVEEISNTVETANEDEINSAAAAVFHPTPQSSVVESEENNLKTINESRHRKKVKSWSQPKRQIQNSNKIKGFFNKELDSTLETNDKEIVSFKASLNFYEDRSDKFPFECPTCKRKYPTKRTLNHHVKTHLPNNKRKYQCSICGSGFHTPDKFTVHMRIHTKERPFKCEYCDKSFTQIGHLKIHLRTHKGYFPFECTKCDRKFTVNGQLNKHMKRHHTDLNKDCLVECKTCGLFYKDRFDLRIHQLQHLSDGVAQNFLSMCNYTEGQEIDMGILELVKGTGNNTLKRPTCLKKFICEICGTALKGEAGLTAHRLLHEPNSSSLQCKVCEDVFHHQFQLDRHMKSHTDDGAACKICGVFVRNKLLTNHLQRHAESSCLNYQCRKCGKQYKLEYSFMRHIVQCRFEELNELVVEGSQSVVKC